MNLYNVNPSDINRIQNLHDTIMEDLMHRARVEIPTFPLCPVCLQFLQVETQQHPGTSQTSIVFKCDHVYRPPISFDDYGR